MDLLDTHQHLICRDQIGYGWTAGLPPLRSGDFTLADYQALTAGQGVIGQVFMETGVDDADYQTEARMVAGLMRPGSGLLGQIASCRPETDTGFAVWLAECAGLQVVGFRRILHEISDDLSQSDTFRRNIRAIGATGRPFDMCFRANQLHLAVDLARACPDMEFVLDHCGVPDIGGGTTGGAFGAWQAGITAVAALPNITCKLSGIAAYCAPATASTATLRPWVDHILHAFTPARIIWGSDWPVVNLGGGLPGWITITRELLAGLTVAERSAIGTGNARRVYGLP